MFLAPLTTTQKMAFMALAAKVVSADDSVGRHERELMNALTAEMGMPDTPVGMDLADAVAEFTHWESKVRAMLELIGIARADCNFDKREGKIIQDIARRFGISDGELEVMDDWVFRQLSLAREAVYLMKELREE